MIAVAIGLVFMIVAFAGSVVARPVPAPPAFDVNEAYVKYVEETLVSYGTWEGYGFRATGSSAEYAAASFISKQMKSIGLSSVRMEPVPVDAWEFKGASLEVYGSEGSFSFIASSMGGVPGTPAGGVSGPIVYVGRGAPGEYPADGVTDKLLLVDWDADWFWVNLIGHQATVCGAKGVIISTMNHPAYYEMPDSIGSFDATYDDDWVPLIVISRNDGFTIMDMLAKGPVQGTMVSNATITLAEDGGTGYNVVGVLRGKDHEHPILILGHHDAWFYGASDDTSAIAGMLSWAKAMKVSKFVPKHDLYFIATTGEEYGNTDAYYEWLVGAWYMITQAHPDWGQKAIAFVNLEGLGGQWYDGSIGPFSARSNYQFAPLVRKVFSENPQMLAGGWTVNTRLSSWQDGWTLTAAGIPGITFSNVIPNYDMVYHTNYDNLALMNYSRLATQVELMQKVLVEIDAAKVLPYMFSERAYDLATSVDPVDYEHIGVDVNALYDAISEFRALAMKFDAVQGKIKASDAADANSLLMTLSQLIGQEWTALSCWDSTIYPTQQVEWDATWLTDALDYLKKGQLNAALDELRNVGLTWNAFFDYTVWSWENSRHAPGAEHLNWGAQGHLAPYVDIYAAYVSLRDNYPGGPPYDYDWEIQQLESVLASELEELQYRVSAETDQVQMANSLLAQLIALAG